MGFLDTPEAPDPPDYTAIADSSAESAQLYADLGREQLEFYKDAYGRAEDYAYKELDQNQEEQDYYKAQYEKYLPYVIDNLESTTATSEENRARAQEYYDTYQTNYLPIEKKLIGAVEGYATPERADQRAAAAVADVANQYEASRRNALSQLESYGVDPSQTRYGALDLSSRVSQAAASAAAGTKSRENTEALALGWEGELAKLGRGYAPDITGAYDTATRSGSSGLSSANSLYNTSGGITSSLSNQAVGTSGGLANTALGTMGTPSSYFSNANTALGTWGGTLNTGYQNELAGYDAETKREGNVWSGLGSLAGAGLGWGLRKWG